jgi:hypothetical protein
MFTRLPFTVLVSVNTQSAALQAAKNHFKSLQMFTCMIVGVALVVDMFSHRHLQAVLAQRPRTGYAAQYLDFK